MKNTLDLGRRGELAAIDYLEKNGFSIRHTNWRCGHREIDIVAEKNGMLHVVEVKTRSAKYLVDPRMNVDKHKQRNIIAAANIYSQRFKLSMDIHLDVIIVLISDLDADITYIPDAYYPFC